MLQTHPRLSDIIVAHIGDPAIRSDYHPISSQKARDLWFEIDSNPRQSL